MAKVLEQFAATLPTLSSEQLAKLELWCKKSLRRSAVRDGTLFGVLWEPSSVNTVQTRLNNCFRHWGVEHLGYRRGWLKEMTDEEAASLAAVTAPTRRPTDRQTPKRRLAVLYLQMAPEAVESGLAREGLVKSLEDGVAKGASRRRVRSLIDSLPEFPAADLTALEVAQGSVREHPGVSRVLGPGAQVFLSSSNVLKERIADERRSAAPPPSEEEDELFAGLYCT